MEWTVDDPCDIMAGAEPTQNLYINHSMWWAWAAVMWMGCEVAPKVTSNKYKLSMIMRFI